MGTVCVFICLVVVTTIGLNVGVGCLHHLLQPACSDMRNYTCFGQWLFTSILCAILMTVTFGWAASVCTFICVVIIWTPIVMIGSELLHYLLQPACDETRDTTYSDQYFVTTILCAILIVSMLY